jgi:chromosome segregation ATPase
MSQDDGVPDRIDGMSVETAVDEIVAANEAQDPETVRTVLDHVTADDEVTADAFDETVSDVSKVVSTAETRTELATIEFDDAEAAAESVADVDAVAARLEEFEAELETVSARAAALTDDLQAAIARPEDPVSLYAAVRGLRDVAGDAQEVQVAADDLQMELEDFERWVDDASMRARELAGDVGAVERSVDTLTAAVDELESAVDSPETHAGTDPALAWFDATLRCRVTALLTTDLRAELADLRTLATRQSADADGELDDVSDRIAELDARREAVADDLDALERPAWRETYGDRLDAFEADLAAFDPPVSWGAVQDVLADHRPE